jgi:hypothetical protein
MRTTTKSWSRTKTTDSLASASKHQRPPLRPLMFLGGCFEVHSFACAEQKRIVVRETGSPEVSFGLDEVAHQPGRKREPSLIFVVDVDTAASSLQANVMATSLRFRFCLAWTRVGGADVRAGVVLASSAIENIWSTEKDIFELGFRKLFFWNFSGVPFMSRTSGDSSKTS